MDKKTPHDEGGRKRVRKKIRIRYRERVRRTERPRGHFIKKHGLKFLIGTLAAGALIGILILTIRTNAEHKRQESEKRIRYWQEKEYNAAKEEQLK